MHWQKGLIMKKILLTIAAASMLAASTACAPRKETLNVWSFTNEVPEMVEKYIELNPEFGEKYDFELC